MSFQLKLDVVVPTVRGDPLRLHRVAALPIPAAFHGLSFIFVVDGPQPAETWAQMRRLVAQPPGEGTVRLVSTLPNHHGWPAGAGAARNAGIRASEADWILFLDDDTSPQPDLLVAYAEAAEHWLAHPDPKLFVFGFAGTTSILTPRGSFWAVAARFGGMFSAFGAASDGHIFLPWAPTANLLLRRTGPPTSVATGPVTLNGASELPPAALPEGGGGEEGPMDEDLECAERASLIHTPPAHTPPALCARPHTGPDETSDAAMGAPDKLAAWCHFDESLPRNGGAEDVDICLQATMYGASVAGDPRGLMRRVLVAVPRAVTVHRMWSPCGMLERGVRWGYAGGLLREKHPELSLSRALSLVERLALCPPMAAILALLWHGRGRPGCVISAMALDALLLVLCTLYHRISRLPRRILLSPRLPPDMRVTIDEEAFHLHCGSSTILRGAALLCTHLGPAFWLALAFELGEFGAVLERPASRWLNFGRRWDFSFGFEEQPPAKVRWAVERGVLLEAVGLIVLSVCLVGLV